MVAVVVFFWLRSERVSQPQSIKWTAQPDFFPLGTMLQGSTVELSVGLLGDAFANQRPIWTSHLPNWLRDRLNRVIHRRQTAATVRGWQMRVNAPDFLRVDRTGVDYHSWRGPFPSVALHFVADKPGEYNGDIAVTLTRRGYQTRTVLIPVSAKVVAAPPRWSVLLTKSPFERYATGDGRDLEPLTALTSRLSERGVRVDLREDVPKSLDGLNVILISDSALVGGELGVGGVVHPGLDAGAKERLHQFVARGGRLIVVASLSHADIAQAANDVMDRYGLRMDSQEAGGEICATEMVPDRLTAGVSKLCFQRPAYVWSTDDTQAKVLAIKQGDAEIGFIGVSRASGRGEVILTSQSLWWHRLSGGPDDGDNARLLENLLAP